MSNALASRYKVPSNLPSDALTNVPTPSRVKRCRRKFKDVDLLEPCIVRHVPLGEVFMSWRDKCESIMNMPTEVDEVDEITPTLETHEEEDDDQTFNLQYTITITINASDTEEHSVQATGEYTSAGCEMPTQNIEYQKTYVNLPARKIVLEPSNSVGCMPVPENGTNVHFLIKIVESADKEPHIPDEFLVVYSNKNDKQKKYQTMLNALTAKPFPEAFHIEPAMEKVIVVCPYEKDRYKFVFDTCECEMINQEPKLIAKKFEDVIVQNQIKKLGSISNEMEAANYMCFSTGDTNQNTAKNYTEIFAMLGQLDKTSQDIIADISKYKDLLLFTSKSTRAETFQNCMRELCQKADQMYAYHNEFEHTMLHQTTDALDDLCAISKADNGSTNSVSKTMKKLIKIREETSQVLQHSRYNTTLSAMDSRLRYFTLSLVDDTIRKFCSCNGAECHNEDSSRACVWDSEPKLFAYNLQQMYANNHFNSLQVSQSDYNKLRNLILECEQVPCSLPCFPSSLMCTKLHREKVAQSMVYGQAFPLASNSLCWYKSKNDYSIDVDLHPCVQEAQQVTPQSDKQNESRVKAVKLQTRIWIDEKTNRIISLTAYKHFCDVLKCSSRLSSPGKNRSPTDAERELLHCAHVQSHYLLKQALGLCWHDTLIGTDFLLPQNVFEQEIHLGYNETALAHLQLRTTLDNRKF